MITLIDFIKNVEDEVFEKVQLYTRRKDDFGLCSDIWVHRFSGKVYFDDAPYDSNLVRQSAWKLCTLDKDLKWIPDRKAINQWVENEVLMREEKKARKGRTSARQAQSPTSL